MWKVDTFPEKNWKKYILTVRQGSGEDGRPQRGLPSKARTVRWVARLRCLFLVPGMDITLQNPLFFSNQ